MASADVIGGGNIEPRALEDEMKSAYLDYAMSVIVGRALPDVRDGLKPVHRRVLYAMHRDGLQPNRPYRKCARVEIEDAAQADLIFSTLMGDMVEPRRQFIEDNARLVANLDV